MQIIRNRRISESHWQHVPEGSLADLERIPATAPVIVSLADWRHAKPELLRRGAAVGVRLAGDEPIGEILGDLESIALVALLFSSVTDGRGYTQARQLRDSHAYRGEIRAVGDVSRDRLAFMERCGINAYELRADCDLQDALQSFAEISAVYQPASDEQAVIGTRRSRGRAHCERLTRSVPTPPDPR
jgi:uncharacterized protein (DUF934 family)